VKTEIKIASFIILLGLSIMAHLVYKLVNSPPRREEVGSEKVDPADDPDSWYERGCISTMDISIRSLNKGIRCFSEAIKLKPDFPRALINRGISYRNMALLGHGGFKNHDRAVKDFTDAARLKSKYAPLALFNRAAAYSSKGDPDQAIKDYSEAIKLKPDFAAAWYLRGVLHRDKGQNAVAIKNFSEAIKLKPYYADYWEARGILRESMGNAAGAEEDLKKSRKLQEKLRFWKMTHTDYAAGKPSESRFLRPDGKPPPFMLFAGLKRQVYDLEYEETKQENINIRP